MLLEEYLQDPCRRLSLPYWKGQQITIPENMKIVHQQAFDSRMLNDYTDERYFRLLHPLKNVRNRPLPGFSIRQAYPDDIPLMVEIINRSYTDLSVSCRQLYGYTQTEAYHAALWILALDEANGCTAGCAIADFDRQAKEGILEWVQVLPQYRRKGVGQRLVNALLCRMREADFATVSGKVDNPSNPEGLYRRCGFEGEDIWHVLTAKQAAGKKGDEAG